MSFVHYAPGVPHPANESESPLPIRAGVPWALLGAMLLIVAFEVSLRTLWPAQTLVSYVRGADQIHSVRAAIDAVPPAEVAFVGSSQVYQGIAVPELEEQLAERMGRPVRVGNYAIRGAVIDTYDAVVRHLLRQPTKPKLIVVGTNMRDVRNRHPVLELLAGIWSLRDWWRERGRFDRGEWLAVLPEVARHDWGDLVQTVRYRDGLRVYCVSKFVSVETEQSAALGQRPLEHQGSRSIRTLADQLDAFSHRNNKRRMMQTYRPHLPAAPSAQIRDRAASIVRQCNEAGVKLIFLDMPISEPLQALIQNYHLRTKTRDGTADFDPQYRKMMSRLARDGNGSFVVMQDINLGLWVGDFYDGQHLNLRGAQKLTAAIVPMIADELEP